MFTAKFAVLAVLYLATAKQQVAAANDVVINADYFAPNGNHEFHKANAEEAESFELVNKQFTPSAQDAPLAFKSAIESARDLIDDASKLAYCVYNKSVGKTECQTFLDSTCEPEHYHEFEIVKDMLKSVIICKKGYRIYTSFAGTQSNQDIAVDLSALSGVVRPKTVSTGMQSKLKVHGGFSRRAQVFTDWLIDTLQTIPDVHRMEMVFVGHSLGSALAAIAAYHVFEGLLLSPFGSVNVLNQTKVIGFGSPSAFSMSAADFVGPLNYLRFHCSFDPVATTLSSLSGYQHVGMQIEIDGNAASHVAAAHKNVDPKNALTLLLQFPNDHWHSLPKIKTGIVYTGKETHAMIAYATLAPEAFLRASEKFQQTKKTIEHSPFAIEAVQAALNTRLSVKTASCHRKEEVVICMLEGNPIAQFTYTHASSDAGQANLMDAQMQIARCYAGLANNNVVPGITVNAGLSALPTSNSVVSESLSLDTSAMATFGIDSEIVNALLLDGYSLPPAQCNNIINPVHADGGAYVDDITLIQASISNPNNYSVSFSTTAYASQEEIRPLLQKASLYDTFDAVWMDCSKLANAAFCPSACRDTPSASQCTFIRRIPDDPFDGRAPGATYWLAIVKPSLSTLWNRFMPKSLKVDLARGAVMWQVQIKQSGFSMWQEKADLAVIRE